MYGLLSGEHQAINQTTAEFFYSYEHDLMHLESQYETYLSEKMHQQIRKMAVPTL